LSPAARGAPAEQGHGAQLELEGVDLVLGGAAVLRGVDLRLEPGERVALVGPSGAGKTSLLRLLTGELAPAAGRVLVEGVELARAPAAELRRVRAGIGFVHQQLALVPQLRAAQNVLAGRFGRQGNLAALRSLFWPSRAELREVHALLERVGIEQKLFEPTARLSGGQQQRLAIARALYQRPRTLLADEPVASVDPERARATVELLVQLAREQQMTLLVSLHDLELARAFFPRLIGLRAGRVQFDRPAPQVEAASFEALYQLTE
jgi:phosphonate transport system ATP-binding protein